MLDLSTLPQCGIACLVSSRSSSGCAASDEACLCTDQLYDRFAESCVISNCTVRERLLIKNATLAGCGHPEENRKTDLIILTVVLLTLQVVFFGTRILSRAVKIAPWGCDDTTVSLAFILVLFIGVAPIFLGSEGLGQNIWTLTPDQIDNFLKLFYISEVLYSFLVFTLKISIVFLYMRIFPGKTLRIILWATQSVLIAALVVFMVVDGFQCRPLSLFWRNWDGEHQGHCFDINAYAWAHAGINLVLEFWLLALPATQVWGLNMPLCKRLRVMLMFGFGVITTIISIIRLQSLRFFATTTNITRDLFPVAVWSAAEITAGLIVACMPASRHVVIRYYPRILSNFFSSKCSEKSAGRPAGSSNHAAPPHPPPPPSSQDSTRPFNNRFRKVVPPLVLNSEDLDKNRCYSMLVTVTSAGGFTPSHSSDSQHELAENLPGSPESSASRVHSPQHASHSPPGTYLGLPERLMADGQDLEQRSPRIMVTQDVSIVHSSAPQSLRNVALDEEHEFKR